MNKKKVIILIGCVVVYLLGYVALRMTQTEIWKKDNNTYVIFPENKILYYMYRPMSIIDGQLTGMRSHIGPH